MESVAPAAMAVAESQQQTPLVSREAGNSLGADFTQVLDGFRQRADAVSETVAKATQGDGMTQVSSRPPVTATVPQAPALRATSLTALRGELKRMVQNCRRGRIAECRVIEILADHSHAQCASPAAGHARADGRFGA